MKKLFRLKYLDELEDSSSDKKCAHIYSIQETDQDEENIKATKRLFNGLSKD